MHFFYDKTFFTEGFGLTEVLWNLHIVDFIADLALKMRMRMHISVKAGIFFIYGQHFGRAVFYKQLQRIIYRCFRERGDFLAQSCMYFIDTWMCLMVQQIIHDGNALYRRLDVVTKQVFVCCHIYFQLCNCYNSNSKANIQRFFYNHKYSPLFLFFCFIAFSLKSPSLFCVDVSNILFIFAYLFIYNKLYEIWFCKSSGCRSCSESSRLQIQCTTDEKQIVIADGKGIQIIVFPELNLTGYSCGDLFAQSLLLEQAELALMQIVNNTRQLDIISIVGMPVVVNSTLMNCAVVFQKGKILGIVPKTYLPNYKEFYEKRWFTSAVAHPDSMNVRLCGQVVPMGTNLLFDTPDVCFGIELCEDVWAPVPPSSALALKGAEIIFNLSADTENISKHQYLRSLLAQQSARCLAGYVFSSCGFGESTTDVVFAGNALIYENGSLLAASDRFSFEEQLVVSEIDVERLRGERLTNTTFSSSVRMYRDQHSMQHISTALVASRDLTLTRSVEPHPFVPSGERQLDERCEEIFSIQVAGLAKRLVHTNCKTVVLGISGGLDSTLALLVCVKTFDKLNLSRKGIVGVTMPGFGTTDRTYHNALSLMSSLQVTTKEISIKDACIQHFQDIGQDMSVHDVTYENGQARERTQILMDYANKIGGLVIGTGDLSELALGWATYNGDHMSMYGVNASIPKTLVRYLVNWVAQTGVDTLSRNTLLDIIDTPISPELIPADENGNIKQKTEDLVGPYELHDFFLFHFLRFGFRPAKVFYLAEIAFRGVYDSTTIKKWLTNFYRRFFAQQFKRSCLPDGPKVGSVSLSPRGDWRMPSDASAALWLKECEELQA